MTNPTIPDNYDAFVRLFVRHEPTIRGFVRTLVYGEDAIDDVMQETGLVAWRKFAEFDTDTNFLAWAATIARFEALKFRRKQARDRLVFSDDVLELLVREGEVEIAVREAEFRALEKCLRKLPEKQRVAIQAAYAPGAIYYEVAAKLGKSAQAFYKTIQRTRQALLDCMSSELKVTHEPQ